MIPPKRLSGPHALALCARHAGIVSQLCPDTVLAVGHAYRLFIERNMACLEMLGGRDRSVDTLFALCHETTAGCPVCFDAWPDAYLDRLFRAYNETRLSLGPWEYVCDAVPGGRGRYIDYHDRLPGATGRVYLVGLALSPHVVSVGTGAAGEVARWN